MLKIFAATGQTRKHHDELTSQGSSEMFWIVKVLTSVCPGKENNTNDSEQNFAYFTNDC